MTKKQKLQSVSGIKRKVDIVETPPSTPTPSTPTKQNFKRTTWTNTEKNKLRKYFDLGASGVSFERGGVRADFFPGVDRLDITKADYARRVRERHPGDFGHCNEERFVINFYNLAKKYLEERNFQGHRRKAANNKKAIGEFSFHFILSYSTPN